MNDIEAVHERMRGSLIGEPAFVIGNGPSLNDHDLSVLDGYFTIGLNRIWDAMDPTVVVYQDYELRRSTADTRAIKPIDRLEAIKVQIFRHQPEAGYIRYIRERVPFYEVDEPTFGMPFSTARMPSMTTHAVAYCFAYLLGCNPIVFLGVDCSYGRGASHYYEGGKFGIRSRKQCEKASQWIVDHANGVDVVNCGRRQILGERRELVDVVNIAPRQWRGRHEFVKLLGLAHPLGE